MNKLSIHRCERICFRSLQSYKWICSSSRWNVTRKSSRSDWRFVD
jgi:hypothetical protein